MNILLTPIVIKAWECRPGEKVIDPSSVEVEQDRLDRWCAATREFNLVQEEMEAFTQGQNTVYDDWGEV